MYHPEKAISENSEECAMTMNNDEDSWFSADFDNLYTIKKVDIKGEGSGSIYIGNKRCGYFDIANDNRVHQTTCFGDGSTSNGIRIQSDNK